MIVIEYNNGKVEIVGSNISPIWFASKLKKNDGIKNAYELKFEELIKDNFQELKKTILNKYKIKTED